MLAEPRDVIARAFAAAVAAADPRRAVREQIASAPDGSILIAGRSVALGFPIEAIAIGKAAASMMLGAVDALGDGLRRGFVLTKEGQGSDELPGSIRQTVASHPVLDERSLLATRELIRWLGESPADCLTLCLLSGGGSALLEMPVAGVSLTDFQLTTRQLLRAGADIHQLNAVRSQLSGVKGGRLRSLIPDRLVNLIVSDVLGNDVSVIASGPTVPPRSTALDAVDALNRLGLMDTIPASVRHELASVNGQAWNVRADDLTRIVADNEGAIAAAAKVLHGAGLTLDRSPVDATGEASLRAREFVRTLLTLPSTVGAMIGGGEYTVTVRGSGVGGRNTEFALSAAIELDRLRISDWTVASLATDGDDALTGVAGAIVDGKSAHRMRELGFNPEAALADNDSLPPLRAIGATHGSGPTGTNVNDIYFAVRG